jgi:hypothetical protein
VISLSSSKASRKSLYNNNNNNNNVPLASFLLQMPANLPSPVKIKVKVYSQAGGK